MPTATITQQTKAEVGTCLFNLGTYCYAWGGKYKAGFQSFQELMMTQLSEGISGNPSSVSRRQNRTAKQSNVSTGEVPLLTDAPVRRRPGRPAKSSPGARIRPRTTTTTLSKDNAAILQCIAAGYSTPTLIIAELKKSYDITKRPNHMGIALKRLKDAGHIVTDGTSWTMAPLGRAA